MVDRVRYAIFGGLLFGTFVTLYMFARKKRKSKPKLPSTVQWKQVGTLKDMLIFPMKSGGGVSIDEGDCTELGPAQTRTPGFYTLKDRNFITYRHDTKEMMLAMTYPKMLSVKIQALDEHSLLFKFRDKPDLKVAIPTSNDVNKAKAKMWTEEMMNYLDCGDEVADWITEVIKGDKNAEGRLRVGYWTDPDRWRDGTEGNYTDRGAFQNYTSYMLMTSSSVQDVTERIPEHQINYKQFRPNFYIETTIEPYAEDNWTWVKIGKDAVFLKIKDCYRCSQVNIDPDSNKFNKQNEPLKELAKYRLLKKGCGPVMGICLGLYKAGKVQLGDPVYVAY